MTILLASDNLEIPWLHHVVLMGGPRTKQYINCLINSKENGSLYIAADGFIDTVSNKTADWKLENENTENETSYWMNQFISQDKKTDWRADNDNIFLKYFEGQSEIKANPAKFVYNISLFGKFSAFDEAMIKYLKSIGFKKTEININEKKKETYSSEDFKRLNKESFTQIKLENIPAGMQLIRMSYQTEAGIETDRDYHFYRLKSSSHLLEKIRLQSEINNNSEIKEICKERHRFYEKNLLKPENYELFIITPGDSVPHDSRRQAFLDKINGVSVEEITDIDLVPDYEWEPLIM